MKVQLVGLMVERRGAEAGGTGPCVLELILYLNFDPAQGGSTVRLLRLTLQGPMIVWTLSKTLKLTFKISY